jgi:hypothetical protein
MDRGAAGRFFERAVTIHRFDCEAVAEAGAVAPNRRRGDDLTSEMREEAAIRYAMGAQPLYDGMRRAIGHLAGLLILIEAGGRRDVLDLPETAVARERWHELREMLSALAAPPGQEAHLSHLGQAHAALGQVLDGFDAARSARDWRRRIAEAGGRIKEAYAHLQRASEPRAGMAMIDFNHACCSCAQRWRQEGGDNGSVFNLGA